MKIHVTFGLPDKRNQFIKVKVVSFTIASLDGKVSLKLTNL